MISSFDCGPTGSGLPPATEEQTMGVVEAHFHFARFRSHPMAQAALALRVFLGLIAEDVFPTENEAAHICEASVNALPAILDENAGRIPEASLAASFHTFRRFIRLCLQPDGLSSASDVGVLPDFIDAIALLADELDAAHRRAAIAARGHMLDCYLAMGEALIEPAPTDRPLH